MITMKKALFLLLAVLFLAGCGESECESAADCSSGECFTDDCVDGECEKEPIPDCCGNGMAEEGENACTCPEDVSEECDGEVIVRTTSGGTDIEAEYLEYGCKDDKCVSVIKGEQREIPLTFDENFGRFELSFDVRFNEPFNIDEDEIIINGKLRSSSDSFKPPLKLNEIKAVVGDTKYGGKELDIELHEKGDDFTIELPLDYIPEYPEVEERIKIKLYYEETYYTNKEKGETKSPPEESLVKTFDKKMYLVNPGEEK